jgi:hypothetical protein
LDAGLPPGAIELWDVVCQPASPSPSLRFIAREDVSETTSARVCAVAMHFFASEA